MRTETVICNANDFDIGHRICAQNWNAFGRLANPLTGVYVTPKQETPSPLST